MTDITEVNPLPAHYRCENCQNVELMQEEEYSIGIDLPDKKCPECGTQYTKDGFDIPFEVFMGFKGDKVPDIDLNFSGEYQNTIHEATEEFFGRDYVFRAGTISTIADRTAFGFVKNYLDDNDIDVKKAEINRLVKGCAGVKRTTGQHPGGLMVVPKNMDIYDFTPIQHPANDQETRVRTTHFDYHSISGRILKLDLLGHDDPTSLRMLEDLTGVNPETIPLDDPETMEIFSSTDTLGVSKEEINSEVGTYGIPEFGTSFVRQMLIDTRPSTFAELVRISGLSHGTDVWLNNAQELIKDNKATLSEVISVRDDIMNYLLQKGLEPIDAFWIMEHVRKGKGLTDEEEKKMRDKGVPDWYIKSCKKIKYMFPKAHAAAYVMMAYRIAYFKVHYPKAFYLTYFSTKASAFDAQIVDKGLEYVEDYLKKLNQQDKLTAKDKETITILEVVIEAMHRGVEFGKVDLYNSKEDKFILRNEKLVPPLICLEGLGSSAAESIIEARTKGEFISIEDLTNRTRLSKTVIEKMKEHGTLKGLPEKNQLSLFANS
jgi:DNA polymerase-3 subunit alpha (Gram-positive type)